MQLQGKVRGDVVRRVGFPESALPHEDFRKEVDLVAIDLVRSSHPILREHRRIAIVASPSLLHGEGDGIETQEFAPILMRFASSIKTKLIIGEKSKVQRESQRNVRRCNWRGDP